MSGVSAEVAAVFELERFLHRAASERIEPLDCGFVAANGSLPSVWEASLVQVEPGREPPSLEGLLELCELPASWYPQLRHREAFIGGSEAARELAFTLARRGWAVKELWLMVRRSAPERVPARAAAIGGEAVRRLKGRLGVEQGLAPRSVAEFDRYDELRATVAARTAYAGLDANGNPAAVADAYLRGDVAVIEDVATLHRQRGLGLGSAAVLGATAKVIGLGARAVALFAEPKVARAFYEPLGFQRIGGAYDCELPPPGEPARRAR